MENKETNNDTEVRILEDNKNHYLAEIDGVKKRLYKIDMNEIDRLHMSSIKKVAKAFSKEHIVEIISLLENILNNIPTVEDYEQIATQLTNKLESLYKVVGSPNLFYYPIKNISLDIYGKAQYFIKEVSKLYEDMIDVANEMKIMGKLEDVKRSSKKYKKLQIITEDKEPKSFSLESVPNWFESEIWLYETKII